MSAADFDSRHQATVEFMTEGLGAKLTRSADLLVRASDEDASGDWSQAAKMYACGNIIERVIWLGLGHWMGYFEDVVPIAQNEQGLLRFCNPMFDDARFPAVFASVRNFLANEDNILDQSFFSSYLKDIPQRGPALEWYPVFRAALIVSEYLTEGPITTFFLFLRDSNIEKFQEQAPSPDLVMNALQGSPHVYPYRGDQTWRESVIAGFIRYTEFLSAMDDIFPSVDTRRFAETPDGIPITIVARDFLYRFRPFLWRFPSDEGALAAFKAVLSTFIQMASQEFAKYPAMGLEWSQEATSAQVLRLSQHFFGA